MYRKKIKIVICYESNCGGETIATETVAKELQNARDVQAISYFISPQLYSDSKRFFVWIVSSVFHWTTILVQHRNSNWVYTTTYTAGISAIILKFFHKSKISWHFHGNRVPPSSKGMTGKTYFSQCLKYYIVLGLHKIFINHLDIIFVPSKESKKILRSQFPIAMNKKVSIVPNGVNLEKYYPVSVSIKQKLRTHFGISSDFKVLLYIGRIERLKGVDDLINVFSRIRKQNSNAILILAHPAPRDASELEYIKILKKKIENFGLIESVNWVQDHNDLASLYQMSDVVVSLSQLEHFPLTMLEAFATKTPYMSRRVGAVTKYLESIDSRLLIKSNDTEKILKSINDFLDLTPNEIQTITKKGYEKSRQYTWKRSAKMIIGQMETILNKK